MPVLLVSLGTSWAVVPEAFHLLPPGPAGFSAVHVLTTASPKIDTGIASIRDWFGTRYPGVTLSISRVAGFTDLQSEAEHFAFEEVLFRWLLASAPAPQARYVCLAGGFKTMSAAMQRASTLFGAAEVFHVLADPSVNTAALVDAAVTAGQISFIRLGPEAGWPQLQPLHFRDFPLDRSPPDLVLTPGHDLGNRVRRLLDAQRHLATHFEEISSLPFSVLALLSPSRLDWLRQPFNPAHAGDRAWLKARPKIELHCHLGGFATHGPELAAVRATAPHPAALPALRDCAPPAGWPEPPTPCGLEPYRKLGDNNGSALLRDPGCLRAQCEHLYAHFLEQNIVYAEVRCSPANYSTPGRSPFAVLSEIREHFQRCMNVAAGVPPAVSPPAVLPAGKMPASTPGRYCHVNLLIIATRQDRGDFRSAISRHLTLAVTAAEHWTDDNSCRVVGVDLAGFEDPSTRAHYFRDDFKPAQRCNLALTVHAGENDDSEGIWSAVLDLGARRLGHALALQESRDLLRTVADRAIAVEMCPYANLQIKGLPARR
jgi:adenosine deaminase